MQWIRDACITSWGDYTRRPIIHVEQARHAFIAGALYSSQMLKTLSQDDNKLWSISCTCQFYFQVLEMQRMSLRSFDLFTGNRCCNGPIDNAKPLLSGTLYYQQQWAQVSARNQRFRRIRDLYYKRCHRDRQMFGPEMSAVSKHARPRASDVTSLVS